MYFFAVSTKQNTWIQQLRAHTIVCYCWRPNAHQLSDILLLTTMVFATWARVTLRLSLSIKNLMYYNRLYPLSTLRRIMIGDNTIIIVPLLATLPPA